MTAPLSDGGSSLRRDIDVDCFSASCKLTGKVRYNRDMNLVEDNASAQLWDRRLDSLRQWKLKHGDCAVPKNAGLLGRWTSRQRELAKKGRLSDARTALLASIGFVWDANESAWESRYASLLEYHDRHGHSCVPSAYPGLGIWVAKLRGKRRRGGLSQERISKLDALEFVWSPSESEWMEKYQALRAFWSNHGHCSVPFRDGDLEKLGWWCNTQRQNYRKGKISAHRALLLDEIGFVWKPHVPVSEGEHASSPRLAAKRGRDPHVQQDGYDGPSWAPTLPRSPYKRLKIDSLLWEPTFSDVSSERAPKQGADSEARADVLRAWNGGGGGGCGRHVSVLPEIVHCTPQHLASMTARRRLRCGLRADSSYVLPPIEDLTSIVARRLGEEGPMYTFPQVQAVRGMHCYLRGKSSAMYPC
jgi:hypothetical protein